MGARRCGLRLLAAIGFTLLGLGAWAGTADAHSVLIDTLPQAGAAAARSPKEIVLTFNEGVAITQQSIRLFDAQGQQLSLGEVTQSGGSDRTISADVDGLENGTYVVAWRAVSEDSHPVNGAFTFAVGNTTVGADARPLVEQLVADTGSPTVSRVLALLRWTLYVSVSIVVGAVALIRFGQLDGPGRLAATRWTRSALGWTAVASLVSIGVQGAYGAGAGIGSVVDPSLWSDVVPTWFGVGALLRAVAAGSLLVFLARTTRSAGTPHGDGARGADGRTGVPTDIVALAVGSVPMVVGLALANHGTTGRWVLGGLLANVVHVGAMAVWVGGLIGLVAWVLPDGDPMRSLAVTGRFSTMALWSVVGLTVSGVFQAVRQVGGPTALTTTTYGRVLLVKVGIVAVTVAVAWVTRALVGHWERTVADVPNGSAEPPPALGRVFVAPGSVLSEVEIDRVPTDLESDARGHLRRSVLLEVALVVVVLGASTILSNTIPAIEAVALPFRQTIIDDQGSAEISVEPARVGVTELHVTVTDPNGAITPVESVAVAISLPDRQLGPIDIAVDRWEAVENHFWTRSANFPFPGTWTVEVRARVDQFTEKVFVVDVPVK